MRSAIDSYLDELRRLFRGRPTLAKRVIAEMADHLAETTAAGVRSGLSQAEAEEAAIRQLGPASLVAQRYRDVAGPLGRLVMFTSSATAIAGFWLGVVAWNAPSLWQRPDGFGTIGRGIVLFQLAVALVTFGVLSLVLVVQNARREVLRWTVLAGAIVAIALGGVHVVPALFATASGRAFNPLVLMIGAVVTLHGLCASAYALNEGRPTEVVFRLHDR